MPRVLAFVAVLLVLAAPGHAQEFSSYALVQEDGTLRMRGTTVHLSGVFIPETDRQCRTRIRPVSCGFNRAALALDQKIQGFVRCRTVSANADGSIDAFCSTDYSRFREGVDLGAFLIEEGLAAALPGAPFEYTVLEEIAQSNRRGIWGFFADSVRIR